MTLGDPTTPPGTRYSNRTAPDRPGDRDQQQAAEALRYATADPRSLNAGDAQRLAWVAAALADARAEGFQVGAQFGAEASRDLAATTRAEEAAQWQAKIEALISEHEKWARVNGQLARTRKAPDLHDGMRMAQESTVGHLRALLDGEQR